MSRYDVGVDVGGTGARAFLTQGGVGVAVGHAPGGNFRHVGAEGVLSSIEAAVRDAFEQVRLPHELGACRVHAGVAGLATPADETALLSRPHAFARFTAQSDATLVLDAYFSGGSGALLIVGTGCVGLARTRDGHLLRRMGWGFPLEQGGGGDLGLQAVRIGLQDLEDGRASLLAGVLKERFGTPRHVMEWARGKGGGDYGAFAPRLFDAADHGDARAQAVLHDWRERCAHIVNTLQTDSDAPAVGTWGGLATRLAWNAAHPAWRPPATQPVEWAAAIARGE